MSNILLLCAQGLVDDGQLSVEWAGSRSGVCVENKIVTGQKGMRSVASLNICVVSRPRESASHHSRLFRYRFFFHLVAVLCNFVASHPIVNLFSHRAENLARLYGRSPINYRDLGNYYLPFANNILYRLGPGKDNRATIER